jgi:hypothetical protein
LRLTTFVFEKKKQQADARIVDAQDIYEQHLAPGSAHFITLDDSLTFSVYQDIEVIIAEFLIIVVC